MFSSDKWFGSTSAKFYNGVITSSGKFDRTASTYLSLNKSSDGNKRTMTFSWWMKVCSLDSTGDPRGVIYTSGYSGSGSSQSGADIVFSNQRIQVLEAQNNAGLWNIYFSHHFSDPSSWYHCVVVIDTTESTNSDRVKLFVNGVQQTDTDSASWPSSSLQTRFNNNLERIGTGDASGSNYNHTNLYIADFHLIDGTALTPSSFGETKNGVFIPKDTSGLTFGSKGWRLQFKETGTGTASSSTIGADTGGNNLHFTSHNMGVDNSAIPDCPENNFATLNSIHTVGSPTLSEGSLKLVGSGTDYDRSYATIAVTSGKWYAEFYYVSGDDRGIFGIVREDSLALATSSNYIGSQANDYGLDFRARAKNNGSNTFDVTNFDTGDIGLLCFDIDNGKLWLGRRDVSGSTTIWYDSSGANNGDPSAGSNPTYTFTATGYTWFIGCHDYNGTNIIANFGQDGSFSGAITSQGATDSNGIGDFNYIESGFLALCSSNLPDTTISPNQDTQADDHFIAYSYTADNTDNKARTGLGFQPDWLWFKNRDTAFSHLIYDSSRGANKYIQSNTANAENTSSDLMSSFDSDGFTTQNDSSSGNLLNYSSDKYIVWSWKANGGTTSSNSDGSITSTVQANTTAGFSIVTYTGNEVQGATVGHGLGTSPQWIIVKNRTDGGYDWAVWHQELSSASYIIRLNLTSAETNSYPAFNNTLPTSTVFSLAGGSQANRFYTNKSGSNYVAYVFAEIEGYSKFGSYTGNGSTDGTFVFTGFRPAWVLIKQTNSTGSWLIHDNKRSPFNVIDEDLFANLSSAESDNGVDKDFLSNGFKHRASHSAVNGSSSTYIYMAFAEQPFKFSNAR